MALLDLIEQRIESAVSNFLQPVIGPLQRFWNALKGFFTALIDVVPETITLVKDVITEINAWRTFRSGVNFNTKGVISIQTAKDQITDLIGEVVDAWNALVELFTSGFKLPVRGVSEAADALEEVVTAFEDVFGKLGIRQGLKRLGAVLEKAGGKVFEVLALIQAVAEEALKVVRELQAIVNAVRDARDLFQTGGGLFLKQTNPRRVETLSDGTKIKIRVGNLHQ